MKASVRIAAFAPVALELLTSDLVMEADGVRIEIGESPSHPGYVMCVITDASGEDQIWKIPTRTRLARTFLGDPS